MLVMLYPTIISAGVPLHCAATVMCRMNYNVYISNIDCSDINLKREVEK